MAGLASRFSGCRSINTRKLSRGADFNYGWFADSLANACHQRSDRHPTLSLAPDVRSLAAARPHKCGFIPGRFAALAHARPRFGLCPKRKRAETRLPPAVASPEKPDGSAIRIDYGVGCHATTLDQHQGRLVVFLKLARQSRKFVGVGDLLVVDFENQVTRLEASFRRRRVRPYALDHDALLSRIGQVELLRDIRCKVTHLKTPA